MNRWWRSHSVRVQLTLWYVAAMTLVLGVYAGAILAYVGRSASQLLNQQLRSDFQWATVMVEKLNSNPSLARPVSKSGCR